MSEIAELLPIGHGAVATYPDRPYLRWSFRYETGRHKKSDTERDNLCNFLEGCKYLYDFFSEFARVSQEDRDRFKPKEWKDIEDLVKDILKTEAPKGERVRRWKEHILSGSFCRVTKIDREIEYNERLWHPRRLESRRVGKDVKDTDPCKFFRAAWRHRQYVLHELLPSFGLLIY